MFEAKLSGSEIHPPNKMINEAGFFLFKPETKRVLISCNNSNLAFCLLWINWTILPAWAKELLMTIS